MTPAYLRILAFAAVASLPLLAQQPSPASQPPSSSPQATPPQQTNPEPGVSQTSPGQAAPVPSTANSPEVSNPQLRPITGELENKLDTKDAKAGDKVVVKTTETATTSTGVEIPKGSEIMGHVIDVAPQGQGSENSRVTIQFDQAQLQGGKNLPIRSVIQSVAPPGTAGGPGAAGGPSATTPSAGNSTASGGSATTAPGTNTAANPSPSASPGASQTGGPQVPGTVVATKGNLAIKTTSIPGVLLIGDVTGRPFSNAAGALLGAKQDVHLENGTVMVVAIMAAPPQAPGGH
jgi:hypothetical protein